MAGEWTKYRIEEVAERVAMGPFGSSIKVETFVPEGVPVISGQHLHGFRLDDTPGYNFITPEHAERLRNANVQRGDVVFTHAGNIGQVAYISNTSAFNRYVISQRQFYLRPDQSKVLPEFLVAYFRSPDGQHKLLANTSQVGVPSIAQPVTYLRSLEIPLPPLPEQRAIAHILGTLDDKIELLRRQNETLEAMARALFKAWFVDFEPVRAKMNLPSPPGRGAGGEGTTKPKLPPDLLDFARELRTRMTDAEALLWRLLRNRRLAGAKFRRQHPFPPYVLDFYCHEHRLAVEIDGGQHNEEAGRRHDARRDAFLAEHGLRVLRFWSHDVLQQTEAVLEAIFQAIVEHRLPSPPAPLPGGEGGKLPSPPTPLPEGEGSWGALGADGVWHWPQHILDLFPDRLVESELGEIPEGWEVGVLGDVAEHLRRSAQPDRIEPDTPYIALEHMPRRCISLADWGSAEGLESNKFAFRQGEILFGKLRPYFHKVGVAPVDGVCSTDIVVVAPKNSHWFGFVLGHVSSSEFVEYTNAGSTGTKMPRTSWADMARYEVVLPPEPVAEAMTQLVQPSVERIIAAIHESRTLAQLRDTLLPKLISGELRVKDAEAFLKERGL
ncbi:hypothetical protein Tsedi_00111 [Tepidimonas sediminis]|uniref:Type I restriction modification DNA specificity domain protein n=1 Tax=Tepidimonas sediminis TaxID=2588941 RepID=A0A554WUN5_9BURK|nr:DUF559 domain-containing protein [Tepidimonas sediminis]TSE27281.1 hypothetical protein Tsedi_00111 [Tepidimonas sediminis]